MLSAKKVKKVKNNINFLSFAGGMAEKRSFRHAFDSLTFARHVGVLYAGWYGLAVEK